MFTTQQAADKLGISRRRVLALIASGRLAATRFGRDWMIQPSALNAVRERKPGTPGHRKTK